jgi:hypothetical protein
MHTTRLCLVLAVILAAVAVQAAPGPTVSYCLPTTGPLPATYRVTLAVVDPKDPDWIVSQFVCGAVRTVTAENQGKFSETWDGLDDNYMPVPPGTYAVKGIYMRARKWKITGEYHSLIPHVLAGVGDSWFPTRAQDDKYPWIWGAGFGPFMAIGTASNGMASLYHGYIENSTNPFLLDLNKPIGYDQIVASYNSGGAAGGYATATDGEMVWCLCDNGGIPFVYRADCKPFSNGRAVYRRDVYVTKGEPTDIAVWRDTATRKRYLYLSQEQDYDRKSLPWQYVYGSISDWQRSPQWKPTEGNNLVVLDGENATELGRVPIAHPRALQVLGDKLYALQRDGGQWKLSVTSIVGGMPQNDWQPVLTIQGIDRITDCKVDAHGNLYVSDMFANQVYKLSPQGQIVLRFGYAAKQTPGHYDDQVFMNPGKLAIWTDAQGHDRLLVLETSGPNRMSEWSTDGKLLRQWFCGNFAADMGYCADPEHPEDIYCATVSSTSLSGLIRYKVDYGTGAWKVDAVWPDICRCWPAATELPVGQQFPGGDFKPRIINCQGHKYLAFARIVQNTFGCMIYRQQGDDWIPSAALIPGKLPPNRVVWHGGWTDAYWWHDANGDGKLQEEEYKNNPTTLPGSMRYWGEQWLDDLSLVKLEANTPYAWRLAPAGLDRFGNPIYDGKAWKKLLTDTVYAARQAGTADALHGGNEMEKVFGGDWQTMDGSMAEGFWINARGGPSFDANFGPQYKVSRYVPDGQGGFRMKWRVGRTAFGTAAPGQMYGCIFITRPVNGLVGVQDSTAGLYHVYSDEGLFVDTLFVDGARFRQNQGGAYLLQGENFSGHHFLNRNSGKVYVAMASNNPCTLFEIEGWGKNESPVRPLIHVDRQVAIAASEIGTPPEIALKVRGGAGAAHVARFFPAPGGGPSLDGSLTGWEGVAPVEFQSDEKQKVEVRCMYDPGHLYLRWHLRLASKFDPKPLAPIENIFTHGRVADTVSFYLQGDPQAKPAGAQAGGRAGDVRLVFGVFQDGDKLRPAALGLYPKWFGPGAANPLTYGSAVAPAAFEHVGPVPGAQLGHALDPDGQGWVLAARIPKVAFPKLPEFSGKLRTLCDFEATLGGHNKFWWANSDGSGNKTTWDEPTEARLYPGAWAPAQWVGLDQMYLRAWNLIGPFGFPGLPALEHLDGRPKICATLAAASYPPEQKVDLAATYTGDVTQTRVGRRTLKWKQVGISENRLDFGKLLAWGYPDEGAAYAVTYLYIPAEADVGLRFETGHGHHAVRGWLNGQALPMVLNNRPKAGLEFGVDTAKPVHLRSGSNELLLRFDYIWGDQTLGLRLEGAPAVLWALRVSPTPAAK